MKSLSNSKLDATIIDWPVHMQRAIDLAESVWTATPNPRVGCVLTKDGEVVGEGWHSAAGQAHAEIAALHHAGEKASAATVFVSLEPCAHTGRTGPCSGALIHAGVARVVIATLDTNPQVAGKGVLQLEQAGIEVCHLADFDQQARAVNPGYFKRLEQGLPYVRLKLAMSLDGRTALANGESKWITSAAARSDVQRLRASVSAVITGINTVLTDDPSLNVRREDLVENSEVLAVNSGGLNRQPLRVVIDSQLRTPGTARIITCDGEVKIYTKDARLTEKNHASNVEIVGVASSAGGVNLRSVLESLASDFACNEVMIEAGSTLSGAFITAGLVDELVVYIAPKILGSDARPLLELTGLQSLAHSIEFTIGDVRQVGDDIRVTLNAKRDYGKE